MDRHNTKRARESLSAESGALADVVSYERSCSEIGNVKKQHIDGDGGGEEAPGRSFDLDGSFGVFDFPWSKDSLISKSEDWKFEDVFSNGTSTAADDTLTIGTAFTELQGQLMWCDHGSLPDPWEEKYEAEAEARPAMDGGGAEGMDCIWSSVLNQPLRQGSSSL